MVISFLIVLVVVIELVQVWFPPRTVSWNDVVSGWIGIFLGVIGWIGFGETSVDTLRRFLRIERFEDRFNAFAWLASLAVLLYSTYPFDFVLNFKEWNEKFESLDPKKSSQRIYGCFAKTNPSDHSQEDPDPS
ncbi:MAG: hypothetical protein ACKOAH_01630, partial [Pirellula sp.]